jgi:NADH:ubiquinone oxidoreductase subunit 4 (subunit M)
MAALIVALVGLGLYPQPILDAAGPVLGTLQQLADQLGMPER